MKIFYYTASGNSLAVAKAFPATLVSIPQVLKGSETFFREEAIGLVFPCYVGSVPPPVEAFLARVHLEADYIFAIMTYGNTSMGALTQANRLARKNGIRFSYLNKLCMVDSSIKYFDMDQQMENQHTKEIDRHLDILLGEVETRTCKAPPLGIIKGPLSRIGRCLYHREIGDVDKKFTVESHCNGCGICARVCPMENITPGDRPQFHHGCIRCYACTHNCPQNAIRLQGEKSRARFRNPQVSLAEIIQAND